MTTHLNNLTAIIPASSTTSGAINMETRSLIALDIPSGFQGTTLKILSSWHETGTYTYLYKDGADISIIVEASKRVIFPALDGLSFRWVKFESGSTESAERRISVISRDFQ